MTLTCNFAVKLIIFRQNTLLKLKDFIQIFNIWLNVHTVRTTTSDNN